MRKLVSVLRTRCGSLPTPRIRTPPTSIPNLTLTPTPALSVEVSTTSSNIAGCPITLSKPKIKRVHAFRSRSHLWVWDLPFNMMLFLELLTLPSKSLTPIAFWVSYNWHLKLTWVIMRARSMSAFLKEHAFCVSLRQAPVGREGFILSGA